MFVKGFAQQRLIRSQSRAARPKAGRNKVAVCKAYVRIAKENPTERLGLVFVKGFAQQRLIRSQSRAARPKAGRNKVAVCKAYVRIAKENPTERLGLVFVKGFEPPTCGLGIHFILSNAIKNTHFCTFCSPTSVFYLHFISYFTAMQAIFIVENIFYA